MNKFLKNINRISTLLSLALILSSTVLFARPVFACPDIDGLTDRNCDKKLVIVAFGDSITYGVGDFEGLGYAGRLGLIFPNAKIVKLGVRGEATATGKLRSKRDLPLIPEVDYTIVLQGTNDFWSLNKSSISTRDNLISIVRTARGVGAETLLSTLTAVRPYKTRSLQVPWVRSVNNNIRSYSQIDFFSLGVAIIGSDNLHPNPIGHYQMSLLASQTLRDKSAVNKPADNDQDGIYDFAEAKFGTSSSSRDSDGDSILDGAEVFTYNSSPLKVDSDGDGFSDDYEINILKSDPSSSLPTAPKLNSLELVVN